MFTALSILQWVKKIQTPTSSASNSVTLSKTWTRMIIQLSLTHFPKKKKGKMCTLLCLDTHHSMVLPAMLIQPTTSFLTLFYNGCSDLPLQARSGSCPMMSNLPHLLVWRLITMIPHMTRLERVHCGQHSWQVACTFCENLFVTCSSFFFLLPFHIYFSQGESNTILVMPIRIAT